MTLRRSHRTSPLSAISFRWVIIHAPDNPAGTIKGESSQSQASVHNQANYDTDQQLFNCAFGNINKALTCKFRERINSKSSKCVSCTWLFLFWRWCCWRRWATPGLTATTSRSVRHSACWRSAATRRWRTRCSACARQLRAHRWQRRAHFSSSGDKQNNTSRAIFNRHTTMVIYMKRELPTVQDNQRKVRPRSRTRSAPRYVHRGLLLIHKKINSIYSITRDFSIYLAYIRPLPNRSILYLLMDVVFYLELGL